jgi:lysozyme
VAAGLVAVFAVVLCAGWFLWLPQWRPPLRDGERYGIDVSAHQGHVEWPRVADDGIEFAYIKATEGGDFVDARFGENWAGSSQAGIDRGAYHFFTLCTPGAVQASRFLATAPPEPEALAPAVDLELAGNCRHRPASDVVQAELEDFLRAVEAAWGSPVVMYVGADFADRYPTARRSDRPSWPRRFLLRPTGDQWVIWQVHGYAQVAGISGRVDLDVMRLPADE